MTEPFVWTCTGGKTWRVSRPVVPRAFNPLYAPLSMGQVSHAQYSEAMQAQMAQANYNMQNAYLYAPYCVWYFWPK
jgi:hypothetical protein